MDGFVAVHTGAGNCVNETVYKKICKDSCRAAVSVLKQGGSAILACEAAIVALENNGSTNAGYGSSLTWDGKVECEASIMDSLTRQFGACTNLSRVKNPIRLARILCERQSKLLSMDRIPPMILTGHGAENYAKEMNLELVDEDALISAKALKTYEHFRKKIRQYESTFNVKVAPLDTVGAVVVDSQGNCTAGCSSGGLVLKLSGRIGQASCYGAGCWATSEKSKAIATCTTGNGEYLMRTLLAREIVDNLRNSDQCPILSMYKTFKNDFLESPFLSHLEEIYGGALTIVYDADAGDGEILWSHTTQAFCIGHMTTKQKSPRFVFSTLPDNKVQGKSIMVQGHHFKLPI